MSKAVLPENSAFVSLMARELLGCDYKQAEQLAMTLAGDAVIRGDNGRARMWLDVVECIITLKQKPCSGAPDQNRGIH